MNKTILPPSPNDFWEMDISESHSHKPDKIKFEMAGYFEWDNNQFSKDPNFREIDPKKEEGYVYVWVLRNSAMEGLLPPTVVYVGMTTQTLKGRMKQHITGMRGPDMCGPQARPHELPQSVNANGEFRSDGFGSESGGKKRLFFERVKPKEIEVWAHHSSEKSPDLRKSKLRELEDAVIWTITKEMDLTANLEGRHWLRLNGVR